MFKDNVLFANAITLTAVFLWIICTVFAAVFPNIAYQITRWWFHGLFPSPMAEIRVTVDGIVLGGMFVAIIAWIGGYSFVTFIRLLRKK